MYRIACTKLIMNRLHTRFFTQKARFHGAVYVYCSFKSSFVSLSLAHLSYLVNLGFKDLANPTQIKGKSMFYFLICYKRVISSQRLNSMTIESAINGAKHFINHHFVQKYSVYYGTFTTQMENKRNWRVIAKITSNVRPGKGVFCVQTIFCTWEYLYRGGTLKDRPSTGTQPNRRKGKGAIRNSSELNSIIIIRTQVEAQMKKK